jgi:hypothetical protein
MSELDLVHTVDPQALERARRLEYAVKLVQQDVPAREATVLVRRRFGCSQPSAWRTVDMAKDLAGKVEK